MKTAAAWILAFSHSLFLHAVSFLVPAAARPEWLREWRAELWHARRAEGDTWWHCQQRTMRFCLGALPDAVEMRHTGHLLQIRLSSIHRSAGYCLGALALLFAVSCGVALHSPAVRAELDQKRYAVRPGLVLIRDAGAQDDLQPTISAERFRRWSTLHQRFFSGLAYYQIAPATLRVGGQEISLPVAYAAEGLFGQLGLQIDLRDQQAAGLVLSAETWNRLSSLEPLTIGQSISLGSRTVRILAILPAGAWRLPGSPEAWLLEPVSAIQNGPPGYVAAVMDAEGWREMWNGRISVQSIGADGNIEELWAVSLSDRTRGPWSVYLFSLLLALLVLPALGSVSFSLDELPLAGPAGHFVRWAFLAAKIVLVLGIVLFLPLYLAYAAKPGYEPGASALHLALTLSMSTFAFWWVAADQKKRCPVCLRRVTHPARVGVASRTFLAWNGTEPMCTSGHTLLHVPSLPTSWFDCPRWVYLDPSWEFLFAA